MGRIATFLYFFFHVFSADATENRRHIHVVCRNAKQAHRGNTVAKIWIEKQGKKNIEIDWSELTTAEEQQIIKAIDAHWEEIMQNIDNTFAGKKVNNIKIK